jgi:uncharacterized protein
MMRKIILDTNFLMIPFQFKIDIYSEIDRVCNFNYNLFMLEESINELKKIVINSKGKDKKAAKLALKLAKSKNIKLIKSSDNYADRIIIENADKGTIVATQDMALKRKLTQKGISLIILRQKKYLQLIERKAL